jgi:hypothetical protein
MALDSMSDSCLFQLERYFDSHPYRDYTMNRPYASVSAHSNRLYKPSSKVFQQFINNQKNPLILDRIAYKLRIKSDLNVDTQREYLPHEHYHNNSPVNDLVNLPVRSATTRTYHRQPTAVTRTTQQSMKTVANDRLNGVEGNAVHVGTLNDLIRHFHREEIRLNHRPVNDLNNRSNSTNNNRLVKECKTPAFASERTIKRPQTLTEYRFKVPSSSLPRTPRPSLSGLTTQNSLKQSLLSKRLPKPRAKTAFHTEKQVSKLTITDPYNSNEHIPSSHYLFPPVRPFGYFTRKPLDDSRYLISKLLKKQKPEIKKLHQSLANSIDEFSIDPDHTPRSLGKVHKSNTNLSDGDDDLNNPPNTIVNMNIKS